MHLQTEGRCYPTVHSACSNNSDNEAEVNSIKRWCSFIACILPRLLFRCFKRESINITSTRFSKELFAICFIQTDREQLAYLHSEKNTVRKYAHFCFEGNRLLPQFVMVPFYGFAGCLVIIALKVYLSKHIPSQQNLSPKAHCYLQKKIDGVHTSA